MFRNPWNALGYLAIAASLLMDTKADASAITPTYGNTSVSYNKRQTGYFNSSHVDLNLEKRGPDNTLCDTVALRYPANMDNANVPYVDLGSICVCVGDGSITRSSQDRLQNFLDSFRLANPYAISDADYGDALSTIRTAAQTQLNALPQPPPSCWAIEHSVPSCPGVNAPIILPQDSGTCYYGCEVGYTTNAIDALCLPNWVDQDGCGSVPLNHLWTHRGFLTFNFAQPDCLCVEGRGELTPWSMQEIERVVKSNPAALKDAISVFGSEAAVMFAVTSAAKTGLANIHDDDYCYTGGSSDGLLRACPAEPRSFEIERDESRPSCFYTCPPEWRLCGRSCLPDSEARYDFLQTTCAQFWISLPVDTVDGSEAGEDEFSVEEDTCLCIQQGTLTPQSRIDVDTALRQPDALDWIQRHWPSVDAAVGAAIEEAEQYLKSRTMWDFALPPGAIPACMSSPGAVEYLELGYFTCGESLKACGDEYCIPLDQSCNTLCDTISPSFPIQNDAASTLFVFDPLCACIANGALTIQSRNDLQDAVDQEDPAAIDSAIRYWGSKDAIVSAVFTDAQRKLNNLQQPDNRCFALENSVPACRGRAEITSSQPGGLCYYSCRDGYSLCGGECLYGESTYCSAKTSFCGRGYLELPGNTPDREGFYFGDLDCLCVEIGEVTPWSVEQIELQIRSEDYASELERAVASFGSQDAVVFGLKLRIGFQFASNGEEGRCGALPGQTLACPQQEGTIQSPDNAMCLYTCNADQGYSICGDNTCSQSCASGVPTLDRRRSSRDNLASCPKGQTACYVGDHGSRTPRSRSLSWECLDTQTNIESCGGCQFPRDGQRQGQDCTEVEGADEISCLKGVCEARSCAPGYQLKAGRCYEATQ